MMKMRRKLAAVLALAMAAAMMLSACTQETPKQNNNATPPTDSQPQTTPPTGGEKVDGGDLIMPIAGDVSSLNIWYESGDEGFTMLKPLQDPLFLVNFLGTEYYLAESCTVSEDNLNYTVKLRAGLTWHDGQPITADDAIFTFDVKMKPETKASSGTKVNGKPVTYAKVDELTFTVTIPEVNVTYLGTLGNMKLLPKHIYQNETDIANSQLNQTQAVGSGPYVLKEWKKGESLHLVRNETYYRGKPSVENLIFKVIPNDATQEIALQNGEVNFKRLNSNEKYDKYSSDEKFQVYSFSEGRINYMGFNKNSANMQDIKVRQAITAAINLDEIVTGAYGDKIAVPGKNFLCPSTLYYDDSISNYEYNVEEAKKLADEAGLTGKTLKLVYNSSRENMEATALVLQQQLKAIGVTLEVTGYETQGFFEVFFFSDAGDWDLGLNGYASTGDPNGNSGMFSAAGSLVKNVFTSDAAQQLWDAGIQTSDESQRKEIYSKLTQQIKDDYCMVPLAYPIYAVAVDSKLMGVDKHPIVPVFQDYLDLYYVN